MRWDHWLGCLVVGTLFLAGCSGNAEQDQPAPSDTAEGVGAVNEAPSLASKTQTPEAAAKMFLEAVRTGDDAMTAQMLTPLARQKTAEMNMVVAPPGSDTAQFEIGQVEKIAEDGARVSAQWSDLDENGQRREDSMTWMLRRQPDGWRIAGVAATVFPGEPPLLLNFEDPEEMMQQQEMLREELARRAQQSQEEQKQQFQAQQPKKTGEEIRR